MTDGPRPEAPTADPAPTQPPLPPSTPRADRFIWIGSPVAKVGMILGLLLVLQVPLLMVSGVIDERQARQNDVVASFRQGWGPVQTLAAPELAVPVLTVLPVTASGEVHHQRGWVRIPASQVSIAATVQPEARRRGLFHATVYTASVMINGTVTIPAIDLPGASPPELLWNEAEIITSATDLRGQPSDNAADVAGHPSRQDVLQTKGSCGGAVAAQAHLEAAPAVGDTLPFRVSLTLHGTQAFNLLANGRQIDLSVTAPWRSPGFTGGVLPATYRIDRSGFRATWRFSGDSDSAMWKSASSPSRCLSTDGGEDAIMGVELADAVPTYLMVTRAEKYGTLFLALAFLTYFVMETTGRLKIHLAQYALLGLSVSLFPLILIALAEPLGFTAGYVGATLAVMAQASLYTFSVVGLVRLAAIFAAVLGLLFGFIYVLLGLETFSLLAGTAALFAALSAIMVVTRRLDWSRGAVAVARQLP
jgi:inner membrane protein